MYLLTYLSLSTSAGLDFPEIWVSDWNVCPQISQTPAVWAFGITKEIGLIRLTIFLSAR
jgi:hypothetical protein